MNTSNNFTIFTITLLRDRLQLAVCYFRMKEPHFFHYSKLCICLKGKVSHLHVLLELELRSVKICSALCLKTGSKPTNGGAFGIQLIQMLFIWYLMKSGALITDTSKVVKLTIEFDRIQRLGGEK